MDNSAIVDVILGVMADANQARVEGQQLEISPTAPLFGAPSPLDSLGLVALLIDIEEAFADRGHAITLSDERAMSQKRSPFRDVPSLAEYVAGLIG